MFSNACMWLANLANSSYHNQIWYASYQAIASWCPYKEITWYKQHYMCAAFVCTCSVLLEYYEFQSFAMWILYTAHTMQLLKNILSAAIGWAYCNCPSWMFVCGWVGTFVRMCVCKFLFKFGNTVCIICILSNAD